MHRGHLENQLAHTFLGSDTVYFDSLFLMGPHNLHLAYAFDISEAGRLLGCTLGYT